MNPAAQTPERIAQNLKTILATFMSGLGLFGGLIATGVVSVPVASRMSLDAFHFLLVGAISFVGLSMYFGTGAKWRANAATAWAKRTDEEHGQLLVAQMLLQSTILRAAFVQAPSLLAAVFAMLSGRLELLAITGAGMILIGSLMGTRATLESTVDVLRRGESSAQ